MQASHQYDDIINEPRHISNHRAPMTLLARASIFAPYAALTGFESQIVAAQHHRCNRIPLTEEQYTTLNAILNSLKKQDRISVTYFLDDPGTDGNGHMAEGEYLDVTGKVLNIVPAYRTLRVGNQDHWVDIFFDDIYEITASASEL